MEPGGCCPQPRAAPLEESKMETRGPGQPSGLQALLCGFEVVAGQHGGYWFTPGGEVRGDCWEGHGNLGVGTGKRPYAARWPLCYQFSNLISPAVERGAHVCEGWGRGTPCQHPPRLRPTRAPVVPGEPGSL